jgi:hypothetical protein
MVLIPAPGMLKFIESAPGFEFAPEIASLSDPAPESFVLVTVKVIDGAVIRMAGAV